MRRRHILLLFQHQLFGEATTRALRENDQLKVTAIALHALSPRALQAIHPNAIIVEGPLTDDVGSALLGAPPVLTVVVGPETNMAEVFERREVIHATAAEITGRILAASGRNRVATAPQRPATGEEA